VLVGYGRTSTSEQQAGLEAQERELRAAGCERVFTERVSSVAPERPQLAAALDYVRDGDKLVVHRLDRLARSMANLLEIVERLKAKRVALRCLDPEIDTSSATGELILHMFGAIAAFERRLMLERQREGIAKAKTDGKYRGRVPTARRQAAQMLEMKADGASPTEIARRLGISRMSVYRIIGAVKERPGKAADTRGDSAG
jgi:DNA invertase Pin-like site-specific DNA recombinase